MRKSIHVLLLVTFALAATLTLTGCKEWMQILLVEWLFSQVSGSSDEGSSDVENITQKALDEGDWKICNEHITVEQGRVIESASQQVKCVREVALKLGDPDICAEAMKEDQIQYCYHDLAQQEADPSTCTRIDAYDFDRIRDTCLTELVEKHSDAICNELATEALKKECISTVPQE